MKRMKGCNKAGRVSSTSFIAHGSECELPANHLSWFESCLFFFKCSSEVFDPVWLDWRRFVVGMNRIYILGRIPDVLFLEMKKNKE